MAVHNDFELKKRIKSIVGGNIFSDSLLETRIGSQLPDGPKLKGNLPGAFENALNYAGKDMLVTLPEFMFALAHVDSNYDDLFRDNVFTLHTEENVGVDSEGIFYAPNTPILAIVNGQGLLSPELIMGSYQQGLENGSARYFVNDFNNLLKGTLPDGSPIKLYSFDEIKDGVSDLPHNYGIIMPFDLAENSRSGLLTKEDCLSNDLLIARNAGLEDLENYFEKNKKTNGLIGSLHSFQTTDYSFPQGKLVHFNMGNIRGDESLNARGQFITKE